MNHRNTLNTRLLPLSILISTLISGGAMATTPKMPDEVKNPKTVVKSTKTGKFKSIADAGSILINHGPAVSVNSPADTLLEELFPAGEQVTPEMIEEAKLQLKNDKAKNEQMIKDYEAQLLKIAPEHKKQATEDLAKVKDKAAKHIKQYEELLAYAEDRSDENKNKLNEAAKDNLVTFINMEYPGVFTPEETDSMVNANLTGDTTALSPTLQQKLKVIQKQLPVEDKLEDYLAQGVITKEQKKQLDISLTNKKAKLDTQAEAEQAQKLAIEANSKAQADVLRLGIQSVLAKTAAENAEKEKAVAEGTSSQLNNQAESAITLVDGNWSAKDADIEVKLQNLVNNPATSQKQKDNAKKALQAIADAKNAELSLQAAKTKFTEANKKATDIETKHSTAKLAKDDTANTLKNKTKDLTDAVAEVAKLEEMTIPATDMPTFEQVIAASQTQNVNTDTVAFATAVTGGTQAVDTKGKVIGSIVTENGSINLAADAQAIDSVITEGTMTNSGGTDTNTQVDAKGQLTLKGANDTQIAKSEGATVAKGGVVTADTHSWINNMVSEGEVTAKADAKVSNSTIKGGTLTLENSAQAVGTTLENGTFTLERGTSALSTTINGGLFDVKSGASIADTTLNEVDFTLVSGVTANNTTVNDGTFTLAGTANNTIVNGGVFDVQQGATANTVNVNGGKFNLMERAQAAKLIVENGYALIAGELKDATFHGGTAIFDKTATISGTIDAVKNSVINVHDGAKTQDADLNLAGNMQLVGANAPQNALHRAAVSNPAQFAFKNVALDGGTVDMSSTNAQLTMASLSGAGTFNLAASLYNQANAPLNVTGDANGSFGIQLSDNGVAPTNLQLIDVQGNNAARFSLSNGPINLGNYKHNLVSDGKGGYKLVADTAALTPSTAGVLAVANTMPVIFNAELSSIQNRLDKQSTSANESGVWINYLNNNFKVKGTAANFDQKLNGITLGGDKAIEVGDSVLSIGAFGSQSSSDIKSDYQSSGSVESNSLGAYAQYLTNGGYYLNGVVKSNQFNQNVSVTSNGSHASGSASFSGLGVALKAGKHINVDAMYVSPYAALSTFTSGKSQYQLSNGMDAQNQGSRNITGTLGVNTGYRFVLNSGAEIKPYALFSVDHDLMARNNVLVNGEMFDNSRKGTRMNAGVGMNVNMTKNLSIGSEVKLSKGKNVDTPVTINLGVGYTF